MTKTNGKKNKKIVQNEIDMEYDVSIFDVRDRHQSALMAIKKKIRGCEKKIRELEQVDQQKPSGEKLSKESDQTLKERKEKIASKKAILDVWKEAAIAIASVRKKESSEGVTNVCMVDVIEGIDLLKQILIRENEWEHYKCLSKKYLTKSELERVRQLAEFLNVSCKDVKSTRFNSFISVVDYLTSPIAIGQDCPMTFSEFVRLFDKVKNTLLVEITIPVIEKKVVESVDVVLPISEVKVSDNEKVSQKGFVKGKNRRPRNLKKSLKTTNGVVPEISNQSGSSIPEKLTVIVTDNNKSKKNEESVPILVSSDDALKLTLNKNVVLKNISQENLTNQQVDSDSEGWETANSHRKKPITTKPFKNFKKDGYQFSNTKNGNYKKYSQNQNNFQSQSNYKGKKPHQMKSYNKTNYSNTINTESGISTKSQI